MDNRTNRLKLLAGLPIIVDGIPIYSPVLKDIAEIGEDIYEMYVVMFTMPDKMLKEPIEGVNKLDLLIQLMISNKNIYNDIIKGLKIFTNLDFDLVEFNSDLVLLSKEPNSVDSGVFRIINKDNYDLIRRSILFVNCYEHEDTNDEIEGLEGLSDDLIKKIKESMNVKNSLQKNDNKIELTDIISSVANMDSNNLDIINIFNINKFTLLEQLQRGQAKEVYESDKKNMFLASLFGGNTKNLKIESYIRKL